MNSQPIPLLYPLQPGYMDADQFIDQLLTKPETIEWKVALQSKLQSELIGACIFDVNSYGAKYFVKFFTLSCNLLKSALPGYPYVYEFRYKNSYGPDDVTVIEKRGFSSGMTTYPLMIVNDKIT